MAAMVHSSCTLSVKTPKSPGQSRTDSTLSLASVSITNVLNSGYVNTQTLALSYGTITKSYDSYCILENDTDINNCVWVSGALPSNYVVTATNELKTLSVWIQNSTTLETSARVDSNSVTLDTVVPTLTLQSLTGGQRIAGGVSNNIEWTGADLNLGASPIEISTSANSGSSYTTVVSNTSNSGTYAWSTPSVDSTTYRVRIRITDLAGNQALVSSTSDFEISTTLPVVTVTAPNGGEEIQGGSTYSITWMSVNLPVGASTALLEYSSNAGTSWTTITTVANAASNTYSWSVPTLDSTQMRIRVTVTDSLSAQTPDTSDSNFEIDSTAPVRPNALTLISPASSPSIVATPQIEVGGVVSGDTVKLFTDSSCLTANQIASGAATSTTLRLTTSTLAVGTYSIYANSTDPVGNVSNCSTVFLNYERVPPQGILTLSSVTFNDTVRGATPDQQIITVTNVGTGPATLNSSSAVTLTTGTHFIIGGGTCQNSLVMEASDTCTIVIDFEPFAAGALFDTITVSYNDGITGQTESESIGGIGLNPASLAISSDENHFGKVVIGGSGAPSKTITITNSGDVAATLIQPNNIDDITSLSDFTTATSHFRYVGSAFPGTAGSCTQTIAAGASCDLEIEATPNAIGQQYLDFGFEYDDGSLTPQTLLISLSYFGVELMIARPNPFETWNFSFSSLSGGLSQLNRHMPIFIVNPSDYTENFSLINTNNSGAAWEYTGSTYPGTDRIFSGPDRKCGTSLAANTSCMVEFEFKGTSSSGATSLRLVPVANNATNPHSYALTGVTPSSQVSITAEVTSGTACSCNPADSANFGGGSGTISDPYQICSEDHLIRMHTDFVSRSGWSGRYFKQCENIALGNNLTPIGLDDADGFLGTYDGQGFQVTGLTQTNLACRYGLFNKIHRDGVVKNLGIQGFDVTIQNPSIATDCFMGALAAINNGTIINSWSSGEIPLLSTLSVTASVGGLVGTTEGTSRISDSWSTVSITGVGNSNYRYISGIVGNSGAGAALNGVFFGGVISVTGMSGSTGINGLASDLGQITGLDNSNLFNVASISTDLGTANGISYGIAQTSQAIGQAPNNFSNYGNLTSTAGDSSGIAADFSASIPMKNFFNFGTVQAVRYASGLFRETDFMSRLSQLFNFGEIKITGSGGRGMGIVLRNQGDLSSVHSYGTMTDPTSAVGSGNSLSGIAYRNNGTISESIYIGEFFTRHDTLLSGLVGENSGTLSNSYSAILKVRGGSASITGDACVSTNNDTIQELYTWYQRGSTDSSFQGIFQGTDFLNLSLDNCTATGTATELQDWRFTGFAAPTWATPGLYWLSPSPTY